MDLRWTSQRIVEKQPFLAWLQQYPNLASGPLRTLIGSSGSLRQYIEQELAEDVSYRLEKLLQAQFRQAFPQKRGRWNALAQTGWPTLVAAVRFYQNQLGEADPTFSPPQPGDEGYFVFTYRIFCPSDPSGILSDPNGLVKECRLTGRKLRHWREAGRLQGIAESGLLASLATLNNDEWISDVCSQESLTYQPAGDEDGTILDQLFAFLQTGTPLAAFPNKESKGEQADYTVHVRIQASDGGGFCEHCDGFVEMEVSREELLEWGQRHVEEMRYFSAETGGLAGWCEERLVRDLAYPTLGDHAHMFFFDHQAQATLDEMIELLCETFLQGDQVS